MSELMGNGMFGGLLHCIEKGETGRRPGHGTSSVEADRQDGFDPYLSSCRAAGGWYELAHSTVSEPGQVSSWESQRQPTYPKEVVPSDR